MLRIRDSRPSVESGGRAFAGDSAAEDGCACMGISDALLCEKSILLVLTTWRHLRPILPLLSLLPVWARVLVSAFSNLSKSSRKHLPSLSLPLVPL